MPDDYLHLGDLITVFADEMPPDAEGFVGADGISSITVGLRRASDPLHPKLVGQEAVFTVTQQRNYSVNRQMKAFLDREGVTSEEAQVQPEWQALLVARAREKATNQQDFDAARGTPHGGLPRTWSVLR